MGSTSVLVQPKEGGKIIWDSEVEVFTISGLPGIKIGYAWGAPKRDGSGRYNLTTVLQTADVDSPESAVRRAIKDIKQSSTS
jgi:hypothetical protein